MFFIPFYRRTEKPVRGWEILFSQQIHKLQSAGLKESLTMRMGTDITEAKSILSLLRKVMPENDLSNEPEKMFNVDGRGIQLNDKGNEKFIAYNFKTLHTVLCISITYIYFQPHLHTC
jgi:hypothetical protein